MIIMRTLVALSVDLTLMILDQNGDHRPSSVMTFDYFVAADENFMTDPQRNSENLMAQIYAEHRRVMSEREPGDPNYIAVVGVMPRVVSDAGGQPWLSGNCPVWEDSNLIAPLRGGYEKVSSGSFAELLASDL